MPKNSLKETLQRLKEIIKELEEDDAVDVEAGLEKVKEGAGLVKDAREKFEKLENEFTDIRDDLNTEEDS
jgi:exodeoxyribonuclease VII small subunit